MLCSIADCTKSYDEERTSGLEKLDAGVVQVVALAELHDLPDHRVLAAAGLLQASTRPRADQDQPRVLPKFKMKHCGELVIALKLRTTRGKRGHLSTARATEWLENCGVETTKHQRAGSLLGGGANGRLLGG